MNFTERAGSYRYQKQKRQTVTKTNPERFLMHITNG